jgi:Cdc6-like AAA superfamily ATPase
MIEEKQLAFPFFSQTDKIFKDADLLSPSWLPSAFIFREKEYEDVGWMLRGHCDHVESNGLLVGPPGTGKTHIVKKLIYEFNSHTEKMEMGYRWVYVTSRNKSLMTMLSDLAVELGGRRLNKPDLGSCMAEIKPYAAMKNICFVIDEVDRLVPTESHPNPVERIISCFSRLSEMYDLKGNIASLILIANNEKIVDGVDKSSMSSFTPRRIRFKEYTENQIYEILKGRCDGGFQKDVMTNDCVRWLSKQIVESSHDLRHALKTLKYAGDETRLQHATKITRDCLAYSMKAVERQETIDSIKERPPLVIVLLYVIVREQAKVRDGEVTKRLIYQGYQDFTAKVPKAKELSGHDPRYIFEKVLPKMVDMGLLVSKIRGRGRGKGGRISVYRPTVPGKELVEGENVFKVNDADILAYYDVLSEVMAEQYDINFEAHRDEIVRFGHDRFMKNNKLF